MKRGLIITFYNEINYGAVLQAYALQSKLSEYYDEAAIVDYQPSAMKDKKRIIKTSSLKSFVLSIAMLKANLSREKTFKKFIDEKLNVRSLTNLTNADAECENDIFLGSDQIWNPRITGGADPIFFGVIPELKRRKTIAYAPSIGVDHITDEESKAIGKLLKNVNYLSVREKEARNILQEHTDADIPIVLDPTLILSEEKWNDVAVPPEEHDNYIFVYSLSQNPQIDKVADELAYRYNIPVIEVYVGRKPKKETDIHRIVYSISPEKFIGYIKNAKFMVTDSFHGTVFSVIFEKMFYSIPFKGKEGRITELLNNIGLQNRIIDGVDSQTIDEKIDYQSAKQKLQTLRNISQDYLRESIQ